MMSALANTVVRFLSEESGQDLIEYAILTAIVTLGSLAVFVSIRTKMGSSYSGWGANIQNNWNPNDPGTP